MRIRQVFILWTSMLAATTVGLAGGCDKSVATGAGSSSKPKVVATISILGDWAQNVGGNDIDLTTLVGPDGDPHDYEPVPGDLVTLAHADVLVENGFGLESWLGKLYQSSGSHATQVVVTDGVTLRHVPLAEGSRPNGENDDRDPHAWQNVQNAVMMVGNIRDGLIKADPAHTADYRDNSDAYIKQLNDLDNWVQQQIQSIPPARRKLVTSHDAFGYFGQRYGVDVTRNALESVTTEASDPSAKEVADVVGQIKASGVPVIFLENIQNPKLIEQIARDSNVKVGPDLYSDALGKPGTDGDSYIKMIRYNVNTLVKALSQ